MEVNIRNYQFDVLPESPGYPGFWEDVANGAWEPGTFDVFDQHVDDETTFLDIGAWIGPTTLYAAQKAREVIAFEPNPESRGMLLENIERNALKNVEVIGACVALEDGRATLGRPGGKGSSRSTTLYAEEGSTVETMAFDTVLDRYVDNKPTFAKIDIEGAEYDLIPAYAQMLADQEVTLHLSTHSQQRAGFLNGQSGYLNKILRRLERARSSIRLACALQHWSRVEDEQGNRVRLLLGGLRGVVGHTFTENGAVVAIP